MSKLLDPAPVFRLPADAFLAAIQQLLVLGAFSDTEHTKALLRYHTEMCSFNRGLDDNPIWKQDRNQGYAMALSPPAGHNAENLHTPASKAIEAGLNYYCSWKGKILHFWGPRQKR
jgi:hypothetical protein